jgi:hypothetical protein
MKNKTKKLPKFALVHGVLYKRQKIYGDSYKLVPCSKKDVKEYEKNIVNN